MRTRPLAYLPLASPSLIIILRRLFRVLRPHRTFLELKGMCKLYFCETMRQRRVKIVREADGKRSNMQAWPARYPRKGLHSHKKHLEAHASSILTAAPTVPIFRNLLRKCPLHLIFSSRNCQSYSTVKVCELTRFFGLITFASC